MVSLRLNYKYYILNFNEFFGLRSITQIQGYFLSIISEDGKIICFQ